MPTSKILAAAFLSFLMLTSCSKDDDNPVAPVYPTYKATLTGAQEVPTNSSTASGTFTSTFNTDTKVLSYTITYTGITGTTPIAWHIHKGAVGVSGNVEINFGTTFTSPFSGTATLTAQQEADLAAGLLYANIHSNAFPGGEIRGQITRQ
jgi:hypothetical protein